MCWCLGGVELSRVVVLEYTSAGGTRVYRSGVVMVEYSCVCCVGAVELSRVMMVEYSRVSAVYWI